MMQRKWWHSLSLLLLACVMLVSYAFAEEAAVPKVQNERFTLTADAETGGFELLDGQNGYTWRTIPEGASKDRGSKGLAKNKLTSVLYLTALETNTKKTTTLVSSKAEVRVEMQTDGYTAWFDFSDKGLSIPLQVRLNSEGLTVEIPLEDIVESGTYLVTDITLLPSFFAGSPGEEGYILLPDGSGALMYFGNESWYYNYEEPVYGENLAYNRIAEGAPHMTVSLPVLGIHRDQAGALGVILDGDALATVYAMPCGYESSYDSACMRFTVRNVDTQSISSTVFQTVYEEDMPDCSIRMGYWFFAGDYSGYDAMAATYRELLVNQRAEQIENVKPSVILEAYGAVIVEDSIVGIPVDRVIPLADIETVSSFAEAIGTDVTIRYNAWSKDELQKKLPTAAKVLSQIGGEKKLAALEDQYDVYLNIDPVRFSKAGLLTSDWAIKRLSQELAMQFEYSRATRRANRGQGVTYMLKPSRFEETADKIIARLEGHQLSVAGLARACYADFDSESHWNRQSVRNALASMMQTLSGGAAMVDGGFAYALPWASCVVNAPDISSNLKVAQRTVPFYQIVMSGVIPITGESINLADDTQEAILHAAETGMLLKYTYLGETYVDLTDTPLESLYAVKSEGWAEQLRAAYNRLQAVYTATADSCIEKHEYITDQVVRVTWTNGTVVTVNYGEEAYEEIPACDFVVEGGAEQ